MLPVSYIWNTITNEGQTPKLPDIPNDAKFVVMFILQNLVENFLSHMYKKKIGPSDLLIPPFEIEQWFHKFSHEEIELILRYMHCNYSASIVQLPKGKVVYE